MATFLDKVIYIYYFKKEIVKKNFAKNYMKLLCEKKQIFYLNQKDWGKKSLARTFKKEIYREEIILDIQNVLMLGIVMEKLLITKTEHGLSIIYIIYFISFLTNSSFDEI